MRQWRPDVVLVDLGLPGVDGMTLARELRARGDLGLIIVSRRSEPEARVEALDLGADDFLVKPVHLGELVARVRSVARRRSISFLQRRFRLGKWLIDLDTRTVTSEGGEAWLTRGEFELLRRLIEGAGKIVDRNELLGCISTSPDDSDPRSVDALVSRLRRKLGGADEPSLILTAPGFGYRLAEPPTPP
jgi:DNA-binding response OmpR family regulator